VITPDEVRRLQEVADKADNLEKQMDAKIRECVRARGAIASVSGIGSSDLAEELADRYRIAGYHVVVTDISSDRMTSPADWKVEVDISIKTKQKKEPST
jgi:uncharacterized phosphosugar-binding protein